MYWKVLLTEPISIRARKELESRAKVFMLQSNKPDNDDEIANLVKKESIQGIIVRTSKISRKVLSASSELRVVVKHGVGYNNIDINAASEKEIPVLYTPKENYESVAEHAVGLIYALSKKISLLDYEMKRKHEWNMGKYELQELHKKTLGVIGLGRIGCRVIELLSTLEMDMIVYDPYTSKEKIPSKLEYTTSLIELLRRADIVTIHCPLTESTYHLLGQEEFAHMKTGSYLINTARGQIIDEFSLIDAIKKETLDVAAL